MDEFRILSATAILGYGFPQSSFEEGLKRNPQAIAVDAGSTDPGPYYLGAGVSFTDREAVKRDLEFMLTAGLQRNIPVIIGSAGGSGAKPHVDWCLNIIEEIVRECHLSFRLAVIYADFDKQTIFDALTEGKVSPLGPAPLLTPEVLQNTNRIVGQMGYEPLAEAIKSGAQVILAGRAYDPAVFAAPAILAGFDKGLAIHLGKILECASICAVPGSGSDCMIGYLGNDYFRVEPLNPMRKCTILSVSAHTLYEKTNPYYLPGPGGQLDLTQAEFIQENEKTVRVKGSKYIPANKYTIKLEGAMRMGFRTVSIAGTRDPVMMSQVEKIIDGVRDRVADNFSKKPIKYDLNFVIYGKNGVMGQLEPVTHTLSHELGIVIDAVSDTQEHSDTICAFARSTMLHYGYEGRRATAGNLAFPFSPSDFHAGEVYTFSVYHLIEVDSPTSAFKTRLMEIGG
jgi:hypothetical protein